MAENVRRRPEPGRLGLIDISSPGLSRSIGPEFDFFLRAVLPGLGCDWRRHRRKGVRRKIVRRMRFLGLRSLPEYQAFLSGHPDERKKLESLLGVTISRFYREAHVYQALAADFGKQRPGGRRFGMLSAGCACGEEPYSLAMLWLEYGPPGIRPVIVAVDMDETALARAKAGLYTAGGMRELSEDWKNRYFECRGGAFLLADRVKRMVSFVRADLRDFPLPTGLDLITCRNAIYTYFDPESRESFTRRASKALAPGGLLAVGAKEQIEPGVDFIMETPCIYRKTT